MARTRILCHEKLLWDCRPGEVTPFEQKWPFRMIDLKDQRPVVLPPPKTNPFTDRNTDPTNLAPELRSELIEYIENKFFWLVNDTQHLSFNFLCEVEKHLMDLQGLIMKETLALKSKNFNCRHADALFSHGLSSKIHVIYLGVLGYPLSDHPVMAPRLLRLHHSIRKGLDYFFAYLTRIVKQYPMPHDFLFVMEDCMETIKKNISILFSNLYVPVTRDEVILQTSLSFTGIVEKLAPERYHTDDKEPEDEEPENEEPEDEEPEDEEQEDEESEEEESEDEEREDQDSEDEEPVENQLPIDAIDLSLIVEKTLVIYNSYDED